jgi:hypothetical protein
MRLTRCPVPSRLRGWPVRRGVLGGLAGGLLSVPAAVWLVYALRIPIALALLAYAGASALLGWLARLTLRAMLLLVAIVRGLVESVLDAVRGV